MKALLLFLLMVPIFSFAQTKPHLAPFDTARYNYIGNTQDGIACIVVGVTGLGYALGKTIQNPPQVNPKIVGGIGLISLIGGSVMLATGIKEKRIYDKSKLKAMIDYRGLPVALLINF